MSNINLQQLEEQAAELALANSWGQEAYKTNLAILKADQNNCAACTRLAKYYKVNDNIPEAKNMYMKALDIDPQNRAARNNLYDINKDQEENEAVEGIETVKELLKEAQKSLKKSNYRLSAKLYARAFSIEATLDHAVKLADAYNKMGEYEKIEELYEQLLKDNPKKEEVKAIEKEFKVLRQHVALV